MKLPILNHSFGKWSLTICLDSNNILRTLKYAARPTRVIEVISELLY